MPTKIVFPSNANIHFQIKQSALTRPLQCIPIWYTKSDFDDNFNYNSVVIQILMKKFSIESNKASIPAYINDRQPNYNVRQFFFASSAFYGYLFLFSQTKSIIKKNSQLFVGLVRRCELCESSK